MSTALTDSKEGAGMINPLDTDLSSCMNHNMAGAIKHETYDNRDIDRISSQTD